MKQPSCYAFSSPAMVLVLLAILIAAILIAGAACGERGALQVRIAYSGPACFPASVEAAGKGIRLPAKISYVTFTVTIRVEEDLAAGGGIRIEQGRLFHGNPLIGSDLRYVFPDSRLEDGPVADRLVVRTGGSPFEIVMKDTGLGRHSPQVVFPRGLPAGEEVDFVFGDRESGGPGLTVPAVPMKVRLLCLVDLIGNGEYRLAEGDHPLLESRVHGPDRLRVTVPSTVQPGKVRVRVVPVRGGGGRTESSFPAAGFSGAVEIKYAGLDHPLLGKTRFEPGDAFKDVEVDLESPGLFRLKAVSGPGGLDGNSNPVLVLGGRSPASRRGPAAKMLGEDRIQWGSIQNHTAVGGHALGLPEEAFAVARGTAHLDFCTVTDHSSNPAFHWEELRTLPDRYNRPGEFVAFAGYEWTSEVHGHRHVVLKDGAGTRALTEMPTDESAEKFAPSLADLAREIGSDPNVIIVVHHTTWLRDPAFPDFDFGFHLNIPRQMLFEMYSWQGSSEYNQSSMPIHGNVDRTRRPGSSFRDILAAGQRFFVTADSDQHVGLPGIPVAMKRRKGMRYGFSGLTAVYASSFDREGIFEALETGRCYGTTGARILVFLRIAGAGPGESVAVEGALEAEVEIHGTGDLKSVQILRDGTVLAAGDKPEEADYFRTFTLRGEPEDGVHSYYLRVEQKDGHRAWTSPIWVQR